MSSVDREIGKLAAARGLATATQVRSCMEAARKSPTPANLGQVLLAKGLIKQDQLNDLLKEVGSTQDQGSAPRTRLGENATFGRYQILEEIGRGGMGAVYKVRDTELDRVIALKILSDRLIATDEDVHRFRRESKLAARLKHPNLVQVFEAGIIDGIPYFTMEFIPGDTLDVILIDSLTSEFRPDFRPRLSRDEVVRVMIKVAEAVHVAHRAGIIHRDLKPANIVIDLQNEPHVMDFGLAKEVNSRTWLTSTGIAMGTPYYMPPEQARGEVRDLDTRVDVYALGAVLYHSVTLKLPFQDASGAMVLRKVIDEDPTSPRAIDPSIDKKLERIIAKAMAKDRRDRYPTAGDFARDLERYLNGQPIAARAPGVLTIAKKWATRNPAWASSVFVACTLLAVFGAYLFFRPGYLTVETEPSGAQIRVDGTSVAGTTPGRELSLIRGPHEISVALPGFREERFVLNVVSGARDSRFFKLEPRIGRVTLESTPPRVDLQMNGPKRLSMKTPVDDLSLPEGKYRVEAFHEGCQLGVFGLEVRDHTDLTQKFSLLPAKRWMARTGDAVYRRPALWDVDGDKVLDAIVASSNGKIHAFSGKTGKELWQHDTKSRGAGEPVILDLDGDKTPEIFVGVGASGFQCLRLDGVPRFAVKLPTRAFVSPDSVDVDGDGVIDPVVSGWDGNVSCYSGKALLALKPDRIWTVQTGGKVDGAAMLVATAAGAWDFVVVGDNEKLTKIRATDKGAATETAALPFPALEWRWTGSNVVIGGSEWVAAIGLDGAVLWKQNSGSPVTAISAVAAVDGQSYVFVSTEEGGVAALALGTGAEKWRWKAEQSLKSTPRAADLDGDGSAEVIVGCDSARLYVLDGRTGLARWHYAAGDKVQGEAAVADLTGDGLPELIFGAQDGRVTAVSLSSR